MQSMILTIGTPDDLDKDVQIRLQGFECSIFDVVALNK